MRAVWCSVENGALRSTGSFQLADTEGSSAYLSSDSSIVELSRDLTISGLGDGAPPPLKPKCFAHSLIYLGFVF